MSVRRWVGPLLATTVLATCAACGGDDGGYSPVTRSGLAGVGEGSGGAPDPYRPGMYSKDAPAYTPGQYSNGQGNSGAGDYRPGQYSNCKAPQLGDGKDGYTIGEYSNEASTLATQEYNRCRDREIAQAEARMTPEQRRQYNEQMSAYRQEEIAKGQARNQELQEAEQMRQERREVQQRRLENDKNPYNR